MLKCHDYLLQSEVDWLQYNYYQFDLENSQRKYERLVELAVEAFIYSAWVANTFSFKPS